MILLQLCAILCIAAGLAQAYSYGPKGEAFSYHGMYPGLCKYDGLYYQDENSFILCSNGIPYEQRCAPGSQNSGYKDFNYGKLYSVRNFCDINLVDFGYAPAAVKKEEHPQPSTTYEPPTTTITTTTTTEAPEPTYKAPEPTYKAPEPTTTEAPEPTYKAQEPTYEETPEPAYEEPVYPYFGKYTGTCGPDGLYFRNEDSFIYCVNGNPYVQPCAPGTKNSAYEYYEAGDQYTSRDFCDINLVDGRYVSHEGYGYEYAKPSFHYGETPRYEPEPPRYNPPSYTAVPYERQEHYPPQPRSEHTNARFYRQGPAGEDIVDEPRPEERSVEEERPEETMEEPERYEEREAEPVTYEPAPRYEAPEYVPPMFEEPHFLPPPPLPKYVRYDVPMYEDPIYYTEPMFYQPMYEEQNYFPFKYEAPRYKPTNFDEPTYEAAKIEEPQYEPVKVEEPKQEEPLVTGPPAYVEINMQPEEKYEETSEDAPTNEAPILVEIKHEPTMYQAGQTKPIMYNEFEEPKYTFHGNFTGSCGDDGLYFKDQYSFVYCSAGNNYVQPCAPGTRNAGHQNFTPGRHYSYRDFCIINLVDDGYTVKYGYAAHEAVAKRLAAAKGEEQQEEKTKEVVHSL